MNSKMMSSMLGKTIDQTLSYIRGTSSLTVTSEIRLKNLQDAIIGTNRTMQMRKYKQTAESCVMRIREVSHEMQLSLEEKRECILIIIQLCNLNEKLPLVHPFVIKYIDDSKTLLDKRIGYIALTSLSKAMESNIYLAVNTIIKDLTSKSSAVVCIALTSLASVIDVDLIPVFLPHLKKLLKSGDSATRCKVLIVIDAMVRNGPEFVVSIWSILVQSLCDRDPHVMSSSLPITEALLQKTTPSKDLKLNEKVIFILSQVQQGRIPINMMHGGVSGPWMQVRLLRIIRNLPASDLTDSNIQDLRDVIRRIFARSQPLNHLHYAIVIESVCTIVSFHPKLDDLEEQCFLAIDKMLLSSDPNILHSGIGMLKAITTVKPGITKRYTDTLLNNASDQNPSTFKSTLELLNDFTSSEESEGVVVTLVKKLRTASDAGFRREIFSSLLRILEKVPTKDKWIIDNYLSCLGCLKNDFSFNLIKSLMVSLRSVPEDAMREEATRLCKSLKHKFSAMQYCTILEILSSYCKVIPAEGCQKAANDIIDNCRRILWQNHQEEILSISWATVVALSAQHNIIVDNSKFGKSSHTNPSTMLLLQRAEMTHLLNDREVLKTMLNCDSPGSRKIDPDLPFLSKFTQAHTENELEVDLLAENKAKDQELPAPAFKIVPYTKSRFDASDTPTHREVEPKKKFLDVPRSTDIVSRTVWDRKNYTLVSELEGGEETID